RAEIAQAGGRRSGGIPRPVERRPAAGAVVEVGLVAVDVLRVRVAVGAGPDADAVGAGDEADLLVRNGQRVLLRLDVVPALAERRPGVDAGRDVPVLRYRGPVALARPGVVRRNFDVIGGGARHRVPGHDRHLGLVARRRILVDARVARVVSHVQVLDGRV